MCLSIPGKIIDVEGEAAVVSVGGSEVEVSLQLLDNVQEGEYVLVHSGFALQRISEKEASNMLEVIRELDEVAVDEHQRSLNRKVSK